MFKTAEDALSEVRGESSFEFALTAGIRDLALEDAFLTGLLSLHLNKHENTHRCTPKINTNVSSYTQLTTYVSRVANPGFALHLSANNAVLKTYIGRYAKRRK